MRERVGCVVVHHDHFPGVLRTVSAILDQGVLAEDLLVVDNSGSPSQLSQLRAAVPPGVVVLTMPNRGYGAAVNLGVETLVGSVHPPGLLLVATHEVVPGPSAVERLVRAVLSGAVDVAGPVLVHGGPHDERVWSSGGLLTPWLNVPAHRRTDPGPSARATSEVETCAWLDGAFCLYRTQDLLEDPVDERYFLYFEEVDLHLRLTARGRRIGCVPSARASQRSSGIPPRLLARNMLLFQHRHGTRSQLLLATLVALVRLSARAALREHRLPPFGEMWLGLRQGVALARSSAPRTGRSAAHGCTSLEDVVP